MKELIVSGFLKGLQNTKKDRGAVFINRSTQIGRILRSGYAATTAKSNGAINIWIDDDKVIRTEASRLCVTIDSQTHENMKSAEEWVKEWLQKIK